MVTSAAHLCPDELTVSSRASDSVMMSHAERAYIRLGRAGAMARPSLTLRLLGFFGLRQVRRSTMHDGGVQNNENRYGVPDAD